MVDSHQSPSSDGGKLMGDRRAGRSVTQRLLASGRPTSAPAPPILGAFKWFFLAYLIGFPANAVGSALIGRTLGTQQFGRYAAALSMALTVGQIAVFGLGQRALRELANPAVSHERLTEHDQMLRFVVRGSVPMASLAAGIVAILLVRAASAWSAAAVGIAFGVIAYTAGILRLGAETLRGLGSAKGASFLDGRSGGTAVNVLQAALVAVVYAAAKTYGQRLTAVALAIAFGAALPASVAWRLVRMRMPWSRPGWPRWRRDALILIRGSGAFAAIDVASIVGVSVEVVIAGVVLTPSHASLFAAGQQLAVLVSIPSMILRVVLSPVIARFWHREQKEKLASLVRTGSTVATAAALVPWAIIVTAPTLILGVAYGPRFRGGGSTLILLATGALFIVVSGLCTACLSMTGSESIVAKVQVAQLVARVVVGVAAATWTGLIGLTLSSVSITVISFSILVLTAFRRTSLNTLPTFRPQLGVLAEPSR